MNWKKKGLIWSPDASEGWNKFYGLSPTPYLTGEGVIRIYFTSTDTDRIGKICLVNMDTTDPLKIEYKGSVLNPGRPGTFDDSGCIPACVLKTSDKVFLYYSGYQRSISVPYSIFTGLAISHDDGLTFKKYKEVPVLDRTGDELFVRSAPSIIFHRNKYRMWYASATDWEYMDTGIFKGRIMPRYVIRTAESADAIHWSVLPESSIQFKNKEEFGLARPWVVNEEGIFKMWYSIRSKQLSYRIGYAESEDGLNWIRKDEQVGIDISKEGWDSEMICFPSTLKKESSTYMFYNGNNNGETGFGWAELVNK